MDIYLNFDGVLHPDQVFYEEGCLPSLLTCGHTALEYAELLATALEGHDDVRIVLNTWWTFYLGFDACRELLPPALSARIIGSTMQCSSTYAEMPTRTREAEEHVARQCNRTCMILDHTNARYRQALLPNLLLIDPYEGLANRSARRSLERRLQPRTPRILRR